LILITVPISVLQDNDIQFIPPLPESKRTAINQFNMGTASKVIIKFKYNFWGNHRIVICADSVISQFWTNDTPILTAFIAGPHARNGKFTEEKLLKSTLHLLNEIYGNNIASDAYVEHIFHEWHTSPFVKGSYSSAKAGSTVQHRKELGRPVGKLYFSGEVYSEGAPSTITGSMETAEKVVQTLQNFSSRIIPKL